jgi:hypothetical protein
MCSVCDAFETRTAAGTVIDPGGVAQSGRAPAWHAGGFSWVQIPSPPPLLPEVLELLAAVGFTLGGLVAGEGCFTIAPKRPPFADGAPRRRFVFEVKMASRDRRLLVALKSFLGLGSLHDAAPRRVGWQPISTFTIASLKGHHAATIPFAERFLLPCEKRKQFERWRDAMVTYERDHPRKLGRSICRVVGCEKLVRGRMLCRSHYYRETGY